MPYPLNHWNAETWICAGLLNCAVPLALAILAVRNLLRRLERGPIYWRGREFMALKENKR